MASNDLLAGIKRCHPVDSRSLTSPQDSHTPTSSTGCIPPIKKLHLSTTFGISNVTSEADLDKKTLLVQNQMLMQRIREYSYREEEFQRDRLRIIDNREKYDHNYNYIKSVWQTLNSDLNSILYKFTVSNPLPLVNSTSQEDITSEYDNESYITANIFSISNQESNYFRSNVGHSYENIEEGLCHISRISRELVEKLVSTFNRQREHSQAIFRQLSESSRLMNFDSILGEELIKLQQENNRLLTQIQSLYNDASYAEEKSLNLEHQHNNLTDQLLETREFSENYRFELDRAISKICKLEHRLGILLSKHTQERDIDLDYSISLRKDSTSTPTSHSTTTDETSAKKEDQEDFRYLADSRLRETDELVKMLTETKAELERKKLEGKKLQDWEIKQSPTFKSLQTQYTLVCSANIHLKNQCEEHRKVLLTCKQQNSTLLNELLTKQARIKMEALDGISRLEQEIALSRRDCDSLRLDYEGRTSSCEQALVSNRELDATITSLRNNLHQVKQDLNRYRKQSAESQNLADRLQEEKTNEREEFDFLSSCNVKEISELKDSVRELGNKLRDLEEEEGEVKDIRKFGPASEIFELKHQIDDKNKELSKKREDYDQRLHIRTHTLKEEISYLRQQLQGRKQEQELFMKEMEVTGQAYEDEQERVSKLLKQIKEKDDANFKLMSERIKANQVQKRIFEEREMIQKEAKSLERELQSSRDLNQQLIDRDRKFELAVNGLEKELELKDQLVDNYKKKSLESTQYLQDTKFKLDEALRQMKEVEKILLSKTVEYDDEFQRCRRMKEELTIQSKKVDKQKKHQQYHAVTDEILMEEVKTYKAELTCPCCSQRKKDHILTKCFHVFCGDTNENIAVHSSDYLVHITLPRDGNAVTPISSVSDIRIPRNISKGPKEKPTQPDRFLTIFPSTSIGGKKVYLILAGCSFMNG
ncbi:E3 ubiquitin-protein ligase Bre1 [Oopsacas minuta]|uniref:E3 ubiquitin protein ligase n=1 Tax=Oopsacas minuta TaxID=111878 RepID=A0AAV7JF65_9METZ|nr:E3 ubiquitin-protein ligase Bre1 [Oopsacas minuta]